MKFGVCYYPEQWPAERWAADARMMREAGLEMVRIAEFAWAKMEPADGRYTWEWLDKAIETLAAAGLDVILGTPTAAPPAWLSHAHPDVLRLDANGRARQHGARRHVCPNSPTYRHFSRRIVQEMVQRYGREPGIIGWQIDNEFGGGKSGRCYCPHCAAAFRDWLQKRYSHISALNDAWGAVFWSQTYSDWAEIMPPDDRIDKKNPSHLLDYYRFCSESIVAYQQEQVDIIRSGAPGRFITHNFMGLFRDLNQFDLAAPLDFVTWDNYPTGNPERWHGRLQPPAEQQEPIDYAYDVGDPIITGMAHDLMHGLKQRPFWIMEQQCGHINWGELNPGIRPGTVRLWCWHALAHGAEAILFFRWRASLFAQEQYHSGLLRHDGRADTGMADLQTMVAELAQMRQLTAHPVHIEVAIVCQYDDLWALQEQPHRADFDYWRHSYAFYHALQRLGVPATFVPVTADLSPYKLVIAPTLHLVTPEIVAALQRYVNTGGHVLLGARAGFKTGSNLVTDTPLPGLLRHLAGVAVTDWQALPLAAGCELHSEIPGLEGQATYWVESLQAETAVPLAHYAGGAAALAENRVGNGRVTTLGFYPSPAQATAVCRHLLAQNHITPLAEHLPPGLVAARRGPVTILMNFWERPLTATINGQPVEVAARNIVLVGGDA
ncbi:MAG: beta-galactosidase [Chloroflexi bacterium]|nr:beta-galactosidase [Ardenticatenaceae bacterium]NOG34894.1 beta-galactosidase [Chloroflexota bacterium]GIK58056.1 MAG: beta-galactosidase [Chloroflexota bacterium]